MFLGVSRWLPSIGHVSCSVTVSRFKIDESAQPMAKISAIWILELHKFKQYCTTI